MQMEQMAAILTRLGVHKLQKVPQKQVKAFCDSFCIAQTPEIEQLELAPNTFVESKMPPFNSAIHSNPVVPTRQILCIATFTKQAISFVKVRLTIFFCHDDSSVTEQYLFHVST